MEQTKPLVLIGALVLLVIIAFSVFTVKETERALLFRLGEIVRTDYEPGLHFKVPFVNNVKTFEARLLTLDAEAERFLTSEKKNVIVDSFVKWRVDDVERFYTAVRGDERQASTRLTQFIKDGLRSEFGKRTIQEVVSGERGQIMDIVTRNANIQAKEIGLEVVDVRLKRIDLPDEVSSSVYQRMDAERARVARELRSQGAEQAERVRADADRKRTEILANAYRDAQQIRGEGDAESAEISALAFEKNPEFFSFYRSLNAYRTTFENPGNFMVLDSETDFFKYFNQSETGAD